MPSQTFFSVKPIVIFMKSLKTDENFWEVGTKKEEGKRKKEKKYTKLMHI